MGDKPPTQNGPDEIVQPLDSSFVFVNPKNYRKYFKKGKVFRTLWPEPANSTEKHRDGIVNIAKWGEQIVVKIHWFVVVQCFTSHCLVVSVHTYDGRGATKSGINVSDHCALVAKGQSLVMLEGERLNRAPLHLIQENANIRLKPTSRMNFSKVYTVEYNIKISTVGRIAPEDVPIMSEYWYQSMTKERGETTSTAQKTVRPSNPMDDSNVKRPSANHQKPQAPVRRTTSAFVEAKYHAESANNKHSGDWQPSINHQKPDALRNSNLAWLNSTRDCTAHLMKLVERRQPGTDEWFLSCPIYRNWQESIGEVLFCPGLPGSGKTTLTAIVVDDLRSRFSSAQSVGVCYFYSDHRLPASQQLLQLISSFVKQLLEQHTCFFNLIENMYDRLDMFQFIVTNLERTFIVIDALDELNGPSDSGQTLVKELLDLQVRYGFNLLGTSRFVPYVTKLFEGSPTVELRSKHSETDIYLYLDSQTSKLPKFVQNSPDLQREIKFRVWYAADGIFLLAQAFLRCLVDNLAPMSVEAIHDALNSLETSSSALESAWHDSIDRVVGKLADRQELAKDVFMWIACAQWPLTISELQHALAVDIESKSLRPDRIPSLDDLLSSCAGFVSVEKSDGTINLVHASIKTFLAQNQSQWFPDAHKTIANTCATYLLLDDFSSGCVRSEEARQSRSEAFPFYSYASWNWWCHAQLSSARPYIEHLTNSPAHVQAWHQSLLSRASGPTLLGEVHLGPGNVSMLHIAAFLDQENLIDSLLALDFYEAEMKDGDGHTPLFYAARRGGMRALKRLITCGADIEAKDTANHTPLWWAVREAQEDIAKFLLDYGADGSGTVFSLASQLGLTSTMGFLPKYGGFHEVQRAAHPRASLHAAVMNGDTTLVEVLLKVSGYHKLDDYHCQNELLYASKMGSESIVKLLINFAHVDIEVPDQSHKRSALSWAAEGGFIPVIKLLLNRGANAESRNIFGQTPLFFAADAGHAEVVRMLLDNGVVPDSVDTFNQTPLYRAQLRRHSNFQAYDDIISSLGPKRLHWLEGRPLMGKEVYPDSSQKYPGYLDTPKMLELLSQAVWPEKAFVRFLFDYDDSALYLAANLANPEVSQNLRDAKHRETLDLTDLPVQRIKEVLDRQGYRFFEFQRRGSTQLDNSGTPKIFRRAIPEDKDDEFFGTRPDAARSFDPLIADPSLHDGIVDLLQESVNGIPPKHQRRVRLLNDIGLVYGASYQESGELETLRKAISQLRKTIEEVRQTNSESRIKHGTIGSQYRSNQVVLLSNLGIYLERMYRRTANSAHLEEAIKSIREAVSAADHVADRSHLIHILGLLLRNRYAKMDNKLDLDEAITFMRQAMESWPSEPSTDRNRIALLNNLASLLTDRFADGKIRDDGDEALRLMNAALESLDKTLVKEPLVSTGRAAILNNIGSLYATFFWQSRKHVHLKSALHHTEEALRYAPETSIEHSLVLSHLAILLYEEYEHGRMSDRLEKAVETARRAATLAQNLPDNPSKVVTLHNLGSLLFRKSEVEKKSQDLHEAVWSMRKAVLETLMVHTNHRMIFDHPRTRFGTERPALGGFHAADEGMGRSRWHFKMIEPNSPEYAMVKYLETVSTTRPAPTMTWTGCSGFSSQNHVLNIAGTGFVVGKATGDGGKERNNKAIFMKRLHECGPRDLEELVKAAAGSQEYGETAMRLLIDVLGDNLPITKEVVRTAAGNLLQGDRVMEAMLQRRYDKIVLTETVIRAAIQNEGVGIRVLLMLVREFGRGRKRKRDASDG